MTLASEVDVLTDSLYVGKKFRGELGSLARLFTDSYWEDIAKILRKIHGAVPHAPSVKSRQRTIDIGVGWIDKGPYAQFNPPFGAITQRVEIADATLVYVRRNWQKHIIARCVVLQAKVGHGFPPLVPIAAPSADPNNSTNKELALLAGWPSFHLWKASASQTQSLASDLSFAPAAGVIPPHGWFIGADPTWAQLNRKFWLCGPASLGADCSLTFGDLFERFIYRSSTWINGAFPQSVDVGCDFAYDQRRVESLRVVRSQSSKDWTELCHQLIALIPDRSIPKNAAASIAGVHGANGVSINSFPALHLLADLLPSFRSPLLNLKLGRRPVVLIYQQDAHEG